MLTLIRKALLIVYLITYIYTYTHGIYAILYAILYPIQIDPGDTHYDFENMNWKIVRKRGKKNKSKAKKIENIATPIKKRFQVLEEGGLIVKKTKGNI